MDYKNKLYKILHNMSDCCEYCSCNSCIFYMKDKCCIQDLFKDLATHSPTVYEDVYIIWFNRWEAKYNELYK